MTDRMGLWPVRWDARLLLAVLVLFPFLGLGTPPLFDLDEGAFTASTTEMFLRGDFLSSYLLGEPRYDKPILIYWLQAASVTLFGHGEFAWRLPSALASSAWILATYAFATRVIGRSAGLTAALVIATAAGLAVITRAATADALLNLWLACAGYATWLWMREDDRRWLYAAWLAMALGFLTKGPVALVIPGGAMFLWCASLGEWRRFLAWALPLGPILLFLAVAAPWFIAQTFIEGPGFLAGFFLKHNLSRFDTPMEGHGGNYFYYVPVVLVSLLPHTGLLLAALGRLRAVWQDTLLRYGLLWFLVAFVLFSFSGTKLPHYVYYGYGGLVLVLAAMAERPGRRWLILIPAPLMFGLLLAMPAILAAVAGKLKPDDRLLLTGLPDAFGAAYWLWCGAALLLSLAFLVLRRIDTTRALRLNGLLAGVAMAAFLIPIVGQVQQAPIRNAARLAHDYPGELVLYGIDTPSFQTYAGRAVRKRAPHSGDLVLTRESRLAKLPGAEPVYRERGYVLARMP
ncbi:glycosyltransferase family 39 protein [Parasulfuritortus cantonensis]|uniref:Glycosyltransferase family 39 protein n=1 Tax=Parasulfuritortus cantonensis TaxID=2528202 RepID=A0A4R1BM49_9PROT|nr:glycosyltransferase family 39 protein [Parasulfuritortus cantonensis]TCJ18503.1 glycosyltransferase family 39 protein [Parasulfuritortus cantonensis]